MDDKYSYETQHFHEDLRMRNNVQRLQIVHMQEDKRG